MNPVCSHRSKNGCSCRDCTAGGDKGTLMCKKCFHDKDSHKAAARAQVEGAAAGKRKRKAMAWVEGV